MSKTLLLQQVTDEQLARYADLIYDTTGIKVSPQKKTLLSNRLRRRLKATGIECFDRYLNHLKKLSPRDPEWAAFLQEITTHETYLFRDMMQWDWLRDTYLPQIQSECAAGRRTAGLRVWSAACSTGDELYTIACCVADRIRQPSAWKIELLGTDIGSSSLDAAREATFDEKAMRHVPDSYRRRYFSCNQATRLWTARDELRKWVTLRHHNLLDRLTAAPFDVVFVKNVLIYFDGDSKRKVIEHVTRALRPGGYLVAGPSEGVADLLQGYSRVQSWLHQKVAG